ncbi:ComEC/Rec2 family competence protein, partial [Thiotrichales bacterium HSG1]|nr:ComEC/Rec2 family competence protein [Thiotrichales bacterium HSG1]
RGFIFSPQANDQWSNPGLINFRYSKYSQEKFSVLPGQRWKFTVRLKPIRTTFNPDSFDSEKWLFKNNIVAIGSIHSKKELPESSVFNIDKLRLSLAKKMQDQLSEHQSGGIIIALAMGDKSFIPTEQKRILRYAGMSHLIAISGLHIGFIAWLTFFISHSLWKYMGNMTLIFPAPRFAALMSIFFATNYALLAGFSLPTQRALIMLAVVLFGIIFNYRIIVSKFISIALLLILLWEPLTVLSVEFWLSFSSVVIILYFLTSYHDNGHSFLTKNFLPIIKIQTAITIGIFPILLFTFGYVPLLSFLTNMVAIPWTSLIVIPLTLTSIVPSPISGVSLHIAATTFDAILVPVGWLVNLGWSYYHQPSLWVVIAAMIGIFILFLPRGFPGKWLGFIWFIPLFYQPQLNQGEYKLGDVWFTLLDVGQGLSAVIRTQNHVLVYDTGPNKHIGRTVIIPFLKNRKIQQIDKLVISHTDRDHDGGLEAILYRDDLSIKTILTSAEEEYKVKYPKYKIEPCQAGINYWEWDEVTFEILHPSVGFKFKNTNDISCVLKITNKNNSILLTGDIGTDVEFQLISNYKSKLKADILVAPHHGSAGSSSISFINMVSPQLVLFSTGYNNKYAHPRAKIKQRYIKRKILMRDTSESGAINLNLTSDGIFGPDEARKKRYWHD